MRAVIAPVKRATVVRGVAHRGRAVPA